MLRITTFLCLGLAMMAQCHAAKVEQVRVSQRAAETTVVFDLSEPMPYRLLQLENPHRIVVDFNLAFAGKNFQLPPADSTPITGLRYARRGNHDLRVVLDVTERLSIDELVLPPIQQYGDRLVLKLVPTQAPRPIGSGHKASTLATTQKSELETLDLDLTDTPTLDEPVKPSITQRAKAAVTRMAGAAGDATTWEFSGFYSAEARAFLHDAQYPRQHEANASFAIQPEIYVEWDDGDQTLFIVPFARWDQGDPRRTHVDLREFSYINAFSNWEFRAGVRKVFWGVAESNHLIDIINQTDMVENIDIEDKLGQPMINVALIQDWGTIDVFALIGFRERTFPGRKGRLRFEPRVDTSSATFDSSAENSHVDWAGRYSHSFGDYDVGLYHFWGTSREPRFIPHRTTSGEIVLAPHYDIIHQTASDIQATKGNWLFKFEGLRRSGQGRTFYATVGGFEYTYVGIFDTVLDLGVLGEYHFDDRGEDAITPFNNDVFTGSRLAFNDVQDTALLAGVSLDLDGRSKFFNVEASRRLGSTWKLEAELRIFWDVEGSDPFFAIRRDDYLQVELARYF